MPKRKACHSSALKFCKAGIEDTQIVEKRTDETIGCIALLLARIFAGLYRTWARLSEYATPARMIAEALWVQYTAWGCVSPDSALSISPKRRSA
jgi:hypothetical protein